MSIISDGNKKTDALDGRLTFEQTNNRIVGKQDDNLLRLIILADGTNFIMKISKTDKNVLTATGKDIIFDSSFNLFKIVESGEVTLSMPSIPNGSSNSVATVESHSLGYSPLVIAFSTIPSSQADQVDTHMFGQSTVQSKSVNTTAVTIGYTSEETITTSETQVFFNWKIANSSGLTNPALDATIKYYLLDETAAS